MDVFTLSVGQGNFAVVVGREQALIVDAFMPRSTDPGLVILKQALPEILDGKRVAGLILTGFDRDHADPWGVKWIVGKYLPPVVVYPSCWHDTTATTEVFAAIDAAKKGRKETKWELRREGVRLDRVESRVRQDLTKEWDIEFFSPHPADMNNSNNSSLVLKIYPKAGPWWQDRSDYFSYLVTGDTENRRWDAISQIFGESLKADAMSAPHHGSSNAAHADAIRLIQPQHVLVSAGAENPYGHPHQEAVQLYEEHGASVFSTAELGSLRTNTGFFSGLFGLSTEAWSPQKASTSFWW